MRGLSILLVSHSLSSFSDRLWDFALPLLLSRIFPESAMVMATLYVLSGQVATFLFAARLGVALDASRDRLFAVSAALVLQNLTTVLILLTIATLPLGFTLYVALVCLSAVASLSSLAEKIIVTQDWAPALLAGSNEATRVSYYSNLRQVYLVSKSAAPIFVGLLMMIVSSVAAVVAICMWNCVSCVGELVSLRNVWNQSPNLRKEKPLTSSSLLSSSSITSIQAFQMFLRHPVFLCSLSYCLLFCTVLCPGSMLHIHLVTKHNVSEPFIAMFQTVSSLCGFVGTFLMPLYVDKTGFSTVLGARLFLTIQWGMLCFACVCLWVFNWSSMFLICVCVSRIGLWGFDVAHLKMMQDNIANEANAATISAIHYGLCDAFSVLISLLVFATDFVHLAYVSLFCVTSSMLMFRYWLHNMTRKPNKT